MLASYTGSSRGFDSKRVNFRLRQKQVFGVFRIDGKRHDSRSVVHGFVPASPISLPPALMHTVGRASVASSTCLRRVGLSRILVRRPSLFSFSGQAQSCVLVERH